MNTKYYILSTRCLSENQLELIKSPELELTHIDFIKKTISISPITQDQLFEEHIVLTSKTAVDAWVEILHEQKLNKDDYRIFCLAPATQSLAQQRGLTIIGVSTTAETLVDVILTDITVKCVTFICGNKRRDELPDKLNAHGISVQEIEAYQTELTPVKCQKRYDAVLFYSPSTVDSFLSSNSVGTAIAFCIGQTTAQHARSHGFENVVVADSPSVESLLKTLSTYYLKNIAHAEK